MAFGALLGQTASDSGGKRVCRFTVGTSTSGWTANDCDYLCDGTDDQVEINAAIQALPTGGGEVIILDGTYNITATIAMNKDNVTLSGNGNSTILRRGYNSTSVEGVININPLNSGCCIANLQVDGNKNKYGVSMNYGIYFDGNSLGKNNGHTITGNTCSNNGGTGIHLDQSHNNTITGNICSNNNISIDLTGGSDNNIITGNICSNNNYGIIIDFNCDNNTITGNTFSNSTYQGIILRGDNNTITGNTCSNNGSSGIDVGSDNNTIIGNTCNNNNIGIDLTGGDNNTITGNTCIRGTGMSSDYTSSQQTIQAGAGSSYNLIVGNNIMGKNYVSGGGTRNTFEGNKYN